MGPCFKSIFWKKIIFGKKMWGFFFLVIPSIFVCILQTNPSQVNIARKTAVVETNNLATIPKQIKLILFNKHTFNHNGE